MNDTVEKSINNAVASVEMEGYHISDIEKQWCRQLLNREITFDDYVTLIKQFAGVKS